ncbi:MAG TPA: recombinase family protein, partial [Caulobacteraceae bacterium]|nr:recombinase family protein [Caulobacteraceae bacterium]
EGVAAPRGERWRASTIMGDRRAQDGILSQELYIGVRIFNRRKFRKHPETGRRSSLLNPATEWIRKPAPELRILDDELWEAARARERAITSSPRPTSPRPKRLLSGLLRCSLCGGQMWLQGPRYICSSRRDGAGCANGKAIAARTVETRVLEGIRARLLAPEVIAAAVRDYRADMEAARSAAVSERAPIERELAEIQRRIDRAAESYDRGLFEIDELEIRLRPLRARQAELRARLALVDEPQPVRLHPKAADYYAALAADLVQFLEGEDAGEARDLIRSAIEAVDFIPLEGMGKFDLQVHGQLAALLGISERGRQSDGVVGAGTRFGQTVTSAPGALRVSFFVRSDRFQRQVRAR